MVSISDIKIPTEEEMEKRLLKRIEDSKDNINCFSNWYPSVVNKNIPSPASEILEITPEAYKSVLKEEYHPELFYDVVDSIQSFGERFGYPIFMKSGLFSNKHNFENSCLVKETDSKEDIAKKIMNINYTFVMLSLDISLKVVIRKYLDVKPVFYAFGSTPIVEEYRLFASNGDIEGWQAYWPKNSIIDPTVDDWEGRLASISQPSKKVLAEIMEYAKEITKEMKGYWSVDFLIDKNGNPFLIDMADGSQSFKDVDNFNKI
jgi:hypothetical protein